MASYCVPVSLLSALLLLLLPLLTCSVVPSAVRLQDPAYRIPKESVALKEDDDNKKIGKRWAVLIAGSSGYRNYRHQADVCHAYQVLRKGGLADENIVVFMYDDIANNIKNPRPGTIINNPYGQDVYAGVPKDYTGETVNFDNLRAVLLGVEDQLEGGSGKVLNSGPDDQIFIYFSGHGNKLILGMPHSSVIHANEFIELLQEMNESGSYKEMVIYVDACYSGSMFEGLLPDNLKIYAMTASNAYENSYATYCPKGDPPPPDGYDVCIGDRYSVIWMGDSDTSNRMKQTIGDQYDEVEYWMTASDVASQSSVMEYGDMSIRSELLYMFQGFDTSFQTSNVSSYAPPRTSVNQRDVDLLYLWRSYERLDASSKEKAKIRREIVETTRHTKLLDMHIEIIGQLIFGAEHGLSIIKDERPSGQPVVDDWDCLSSMVRVFQAHCGLLIHYGEKQMTAFVNICNRGISEGTMEEACIGACQAYDPKKWKPLID